jgi:hypothetical protein
MCTFIWFISGFTSGMAVRAVIPAAKRPMVVLFSGSILLFLLLFHPRSAQPHILVYFIDTLVLTVSILMPAVPIDGSSSCAVYATGENL